MSREEVERLRADIDVGLRDASGRAARSSVEALEKLVDIALSSIPTSYTPREEVTEGWYVARGVAATAREPIEVMRLKRDGRMHVVIMGSEPEYELSEWTDFLPVPAWLMEGMGDSPK